MERLKLKKSTLLWLLSFLLPVALLGATGVVINNDIIQVDNIKIDGNAITSENTNGDINLTPNGTGGVVVDGDLQVDNLNLATNSIISTNTNGDINFTPNGTGGVVAGGDFTVDNLNLDGNTIISTNTNGDINLTPNGTGGVVANGDLQVDNININGNTIISTDTDGDININPNGSGSVVVDSEIYAGGTSGVTINSAGISSAGTDADLYLQANGSGQVFSTADLRLPSEGTVYFGDGATDSVLMKAPATLDSTWTFTLPTGPGTNGYVLSTNGSGTTSWIAAGGTAVTGQYCRISWGYASNAFWQVAGTSFATPAADTDYPTPTVTTTTLGTANGATCSAPGTKVPSLVATDLPAGEYKIYAMYGGASDSTNRCHARMTDGTTTGNHVMYGGAASIHSNPRPEVNIVYASTTTATFSIQLASSSGSACYISNGYDSGLTNTTIYIDRVR